MAEEPSSSGRKPAANGAQSMDMAGSGAKLLAVADPAARQGLVRLNTPDPLAGEQTWPTTEVGDVQALAICHFITCHSMITRAVQGHCSANQQALTCPIHLLKIALNPSRPNSELFCTTATLQLSGTTMVKCEAPY